MFDCFQSMDNELQYEHDVYDELLTQAEIQGNINKVNSMYIIIKWYFYRTKIIHTKIKLIISYNKNVF